MADRVEHDLTRRHATQRPNVVDDIGRAAVCADDQAVLARVDHERAHTDSGNSVGPTPPRRPSVLAHVEAELGAEIEQLGINGVLLERQAVTTDIASGQVRPGVSSVTRHQDVGSPARATVIVGDDVGGIRMVLAGFDMRQPCVAWHASHALLEACPRRTSIPRHMETPVIRRDPQCLGLERTRRDA